VSQAGKMNAMLAKLDKLQAALMWNGLYLFAVVVVYNTRLLWLRMTMTYSWRFTFLPCLSGKE
jgi:hypothetical protein